MYNVKTEGGEILAQVPSGGDIISTNKSKASIIPDQWEALLPGQHGARAGVLQEDEHLPGLPRHGEPERE